MPLTKKEAVALARDLLAIRAGEKDHLDKIHTYWRGKQALPVIPTGVPTEVKRMAEMSRINVIKLAVNIPAQALFVDGIRSAQSIENDPAWEIWQANKMDAHQTAIHRAAVAYALAYTVVLPGTPHSVIRGASPRAMTTIYGEDPEWPLYALEVFRSGKDTLYRLYDDTSVYYLDEQTENPDPGHTWTPGYIEDRVHALGVTPVVRYRNIEDLDDEALGEVEDLMPLQDQMDFTTFDLLVAQHFSAFRQRYVIGWTSDDENAKAKAAASRLMTFDDGPDDIKLGEFDQTDLSGYLDSRQATLEHMATIGQIAPQHLMGKLINLSAEALAAAEAGQQRKQNAVETTFGESHEQTIRLAAAAEGIKVDDDAEVRWRDTEARAFASTVDGLGKLATMLNVPVEMLWEKIPNWTQQDVENAKALAKSGDSIAQLAELLDRQAAPTT